jgi:hypothetical protein
MNWKGSGREWSLCIQSTVTTIARRDWGKSWETLARMARNPAEIWREHLPSVNLGTPLRPVLVWSTRLPVRPVWFPSCAGNFWWWRNDLRHYFLMTRSRRCFTCTSVRFFNKLLKTEHTLSWDANSSSTSHEIWRPLQKPNVRYHSHTSSQHWTLYISSWILSACSHTAV